jgi:hypothetical protein
MSWLGIWREKCPPHDDDDDGGLDVSSSSSDDDGGLDVSSSGSDSDSDSYGGAPPVATTSA